MKVEIKKATIKDAEILANLGAVTFYEAYNDVKLDVHLKDYIAQAFVKDEIALSISSGLAVYIIAFDAERPVGYAKLRWDRTHPMLPEGNHMEIERIYVCRKFWRHKIGSGLLDEIIKTAVRENYNFIWLGVWQENKRAISFYEKAGFKIFGVKKFFVGSEENDDYVMRLNL